jgi:hypothetical protein
VTTTGLPTPTLSESGALPSGVTFVDNGNGAATLAGTPAAGAGGTYAMTITAANGELPNATQSFTLTVSQSPAITTAASTTFTAGTAGTFTVTSTGLPIPTLTESGALPSGVTFVNNGNGIATLAGTPAAGTGGTYAVTITAANGVAPNATQSFTLTVNQAPAITTAASTTFTAGTAGTFTVTATGLPTPTLTESGALPSGVTFVNNGNGTATLAGTPAAGAAGTYNLTIAAANGVGTPATQNFTLSVAIVAPPRVVRLQRFGVRTQPTRIVLSFDEPMNRGLAELKTNYVFRPVVRGRVATGPHRAIRVTSAVYDPATHTVTLTTAQRLNIHQVFQITVTGIAPHGLTNQFGTLLDGKGNGLPGNNFVKNFTGL